MLVEWIEKWKQLEKANQLILSQFIDLAETFGMPVRLLRYVQKHYTIKFHPSTGASHIQPWWNQLILYDSTVRGLQHSVKVPASQVSVQTLYHEATHAYIDIVDADETALFKQAISRYRGARLQTGQTADDPERVAQEAAGEYVGHRAATVWSTWNKLALLKKLLDGRDNKTIPAARANQLITLMGSIPADYNDSMKRRVFGYQDVNDRQVKVANEPIPQPLQAYCDAVILENKIKSDFDHMNPLRFAYEPLQVRLDCGLL